MSIWGDVQYIGGYHEYIGGIYIYFKKVGVTCCNMSRYIVNYNYFSVTCGVTCGVI